METKKLEDEIIEKTVDKVEDFWGKHNITTRFTVISSSLLLILLTCVNIFTQYDIKHFDEMFTTISNMVLYISIAIILGVNGLKQIVKLKGK